MLTFTPTQLEMLQCAVDCEVDNQVRLVQARAAAITQLETYFTSEDADEKQCPAPIRAAIQFTARPFSPFIIMLRAAIHAAIKAASQPDTPETQDDLDTPDDDEHPARAIERMLRQQVRDAQLRNSQG